MARLEERTAGDPWSAHIDDHNAIANHLNGHQACPTCLAVIDDEDAEAHRRMHIGRAIAAR